jgi:hypothetical protein
MTIPANITLLIKQNGGAPSAGPVTAAFSDQIILSLGNASGVKKAKYRIHEFPAGFALPAGWTQDAVNSYSYTIANGADAPAFALPASGNDLRGKYFFDVEVNDRLRSGTVANDLYAKAALKIPFTSGLEDIGFLEGNEFDPVRQYVSALKALVRALDVAVISGGGVSLHSLLSGLSGDDHTQYDLARRPLSAYTGAASTAALADARKTITTSHTADNTFTIPKQATTAWSSETLLTGINVGAGSMTLTPDATVTLNAISLVVPTNGWWYAKRTASNVWQCFTGGGTGGGGGTGDFRADGTVPATGTFDLNGHRIGNLADATLSDEATALGQVLSIVAAVPPGLGFAYTRSSTTTDADPGAGTLRLDSATMTSVTQVFVADQNFPGTDVSVWMQSLTGSRIRISSAANREIYADFNVTGITDATGYTKLAVSPAGNNGTLPTTAGGVFITTAPGGTPGSAGTNGTDGILGDGFSFTMSANTGNADPGAGLFRWNAANSSGAGGASAVTHAYVDLVDALGNTVTAWWDLMGASSSTTKGYLFFFSKADPSKYALFTLTAVTTPGGGGYRDLSITHVMSNGPLPTTSQGIGISFSRIGDPGLPGTGGTDGFAWTSDLASQTNADPGSGKIRYQNASPHLSTALYVSNTEILGSDTSAWQATLDDSTSAIKSLIKIYSKNDPSKWLYFACTAVIPHTGYTELTVTPLTHNSAITNTAGDTGTAISRTGDLGATGPTGLTGPLAPAISAPRRGISRSRPSVGATLSRLARTTTPTASMRRTCPRTRAMASVRTSTRQRSRLRILVHSSRSSKRATRSISPMAA